jgi:hypothetical protein
MNNSPVDGLILFLVLTLFITLVAISLGIR